ncbi:MAG TPA: class II aldolase/adducin family protein [Dongiaceae bacterium]|nr:class II aldolase/adducin family protein [Dongiaceae bacterium]
MPEQEGVIQYRLEFSAARAPDYERFALLNYWRCYLFRLGLVGQDTHRYGGLGYGNISARLQRDSHEFIITGTQTGHLPLLCRHHYVCVTDFDVTSNFLRARGPVPPSSEALTHASLYLAHPAIQSVMHVHCPLIWRQAQVMGLACVAEDIGYGTPAMADAVQLLAGTSPGHGVIAMLGHEDGIMIYGEHEDSAGALVCELLQQAQDQTALGPSG